MMDEHSEDPICRFWSIGACSKKYPSGLIKNMPIRVIVEPKDKAILKWLDRDAQAVLRKFMLELELEMREKFKYWLKGLFVLFKLHSHTENNKMVVEMSTKFTGIIERVLLGEVVSHVGKVSGVTSLENIKTKIFEDIKKLVGDKFEECTRNVYSRVDYVLPTCPNVDNL